MTERKPPFRADHVGSLIRPARLLAVPVALASLPLGTGYAAARESGLWTPMGDAAPSRGPGAVAAAAHGAVEAACE